MHIYAQIKSANLRILAQNELKRSEIYLHSPNQVIGGPRVLAIYWKWLELQKQLVSFYTF